ncbi:MAG: AIPR family protein [Pyrinomonadaceae bacterium]
MRYRISTSADHVRTLKNPNDETIRIIHALVNVYNLPMNLPLDPDPRRPKTTGKVPPRIESSLRTNDGKFHLLNRGITISAEKAEFDNKIGELILTLPDGDGQYGIIDGGHTFHTIVRVLAKEAKARELLTHDELESMPLEFSDQYVHLEILEKVESHLADIAEARNFSVELKGWTLANYRGDFDWLLNAIGRVDADKIIRVSENDEQPVPILDVVQILGAVNPTLFPDEKPAQDAYKTAGKILGYLIDEDDPYKFKKLSKISKDVLRLYDYVRVSFGEKYSIPDESGKRGRLGAKKEVKDLKDRRGGKAKATYHWLDTSKPPVKGDFVIDKGLAIPLISGFRVLLAEGSDGEFEWLTDPFAFFDKYGDKLVRVVMSASNEGGGEPWAVGRDPQVYGRLTSEIRRWYLEGQFMNRGESIAA